MVYTLNFRILIILKRRKQSVIGKLQKSRVKFCAHHFFCSQVFKTMSNVLISDINVKYCFDCFLLTGANKVGSLADVEFILVWVAGK